MTDIFNAKEHTPELVLTKDAHAKGNASTKIGNFNNWLALKITNSVGSMWAAYVFCVLAVISLPAAIASGSPLIIISWIAQTFLQLVLLPIILVAQNIQSAADDERAKADHLTLTAIHTLTVEVHTINEMQTEILTELKQQ